MDKTQVNEHGSTEGALPAAQADGGGSPFSWAVSPRESTTGIPP